MKNHDDLAKELINLMLSKYNIDYAYIKEHQHIDGVPWYEYYTFTEQEANEFKEKAVALIKKREKCSQRYAEESFMWFNLMWGLKIKEL